jgi:tetratricopeptide (TPR) repeat protein/transcriptional regulator with XRE-family HTH domain
MLESTSDPFGTLLKRFRKRQHLTQQQLARTMSIHRNTIGRWEEGSFLPESKALVLDLARHLYLDEQETRQLLDTSLITPKTIWHPPYPRNPFFTGREETLATLHTNLGLGRQPTPTRAYALHGLGGIGKTQLALEYAYRYVLEYRAIFWIGAETVEQVHASLLRIAEQLNLPERMEIDQQRIVAAVQHWLETHSEWLLIWDNLEDLDLLPHFLPANRQGAILITTRRQALGTVAQGINLAPMVEEEGMLLLLRSAKVLKVEVDGEQLRQLTIKMPAEYVAASELVTILGGLPLALDQAGAYIEETGCGLIGYLRRYKQQRVRLLDRRGVPGRDHPQSVTATFGLASEQVEREQRAAADILRLCAFLHAESIPEELFGAGAAYLGAELSSLAADPFYFDQAITVLRNLSLLQRQPETHTLSIHRLMQAVLRERMSTQEQTLWLERAIRALNAAFPEATHDAWKQCERLLPHVLACTTTIILGPFGDQALVEVLRKAADYLRECALHEQARPLYQQALHIGEQVFGTDHLALVPVLSGLAHLFVEQGHYEQAEPLYLQALHIGKQAGGTEHFALTHPLSGLARLHKEQGNFEQAEVLYQQALQIGEQAWGLEHPFVALTLSHLASLSKDQGNFELAERLLKRALLMQEQVLGLEHPEIATSLNSLAIVYWRQGKYSQAESFYQRALHIREQTLGSEHPLLARPLNNLAIIYAEQGKYEQAELLFRQAQQIWERTWGTEHPQVAASLNNLGELYLRQEKYAQAEPLFQQALHIGKHVWGPEHPDLATLLNTLAELYLRQEKYAEAELLFQQALHIWEQMGGQARHQVATSLNGLANLSLRQGKIEQAGSWLERALRIREEFLGPQHPETAQTLHDLAIFQQKQGDLSEALLLAERAIEIQVQSLGDAHPKTIATRMLYTQFVQEQTYTQKKAASERNEEEILDSEKREYQETSTSLLALAAANPSLSENDPLQEFLISCCELHTLAWCRISDLWQTYAQWTALHQRYIPLSRRAFAAQVKALGCRADRTSTARIWRGITLVNKNL